MDMMTYNQVKDVGAKIRTIVAGETIAKGQVITTHGGQARVNKRRSAKEILVTSSVYARMIPLDSTHALYINSTVNSATAWVVTMTTDGSAPIVGTSITLSSSVAGVSPYMTACKLDSTHVVVAGIAATSTSATINAIVLTISGTTITQGAVISTGGTINTSGSLSAFTLCTVDASRAVLLCTMSSSCMGIVLSISGATITAGPTNTLCANVAPESYYDCTTLLDATHIMYTTSNGGNDSYGVIQVTGTTIASALNPIPLNTHNKMGMSICKLDSTHVIIGNTTSKTISVLTLDANNYGVIATGVVCNVGVAPASIVPIDYNHYLINDYNNGVQIAILNGTSLSVGNPNAITSAGSAGTGTYCTTVMDNAHALMSCGGYVQTLFIIHDTVNDYAFNYGIAMNNVNAGDTLSVLISGSSNAIYTGLTVGERYYNYNGNLVVGGYPKHLVYFSATVAGNNIEMDNTANYPYAIAIDMNEIQILEPLNSRGVIY
jgi:hypothetical protein